MEHKRRRLGFLDILVILVVLAVIGAAVYYFSNNTVGDSAAASGQDEITYVLQIENVNADFADQVIIGDGVYDSEADTYIGKVTAAEVVPYSVDSYQEDTGTVVSKEVEGKYNGRITVKASADISDSETSVNGINVMVGSNLNVRTSNEGGVAYCVKLEEPDND